MLTHAEARVLGSLIEKQLTTPDAYPLTLKALTTACNQTTNRDPVVTLDPHLVETAVLVLKTEGLARVVHPGSGERATKYRQVADEALRLDEAERAVLCVLLLRGAQTAGELRARSDRLHRFTATEDVETTLQRLAARPEPLVVRLERRAGQKEERWIQLLEADPHVPEGSGGGGRVDEPGRTDRLSALEERVERLEAELGALRAALGDPLDPATPPPQPF